MSRNKMIKFVHETTGLSYGECRRLLKKYNWDVWKASGMESALYTILEESLSNIAEAITGLLDAVVDTLKGIDWQAIAEAVIEAQRNLEENNDEDRVLLPDGQDPNSYGTGKRCGF